MSSTVEKEMAVISYSLKIKMSPSFHPLSSPNVGTWDGPEPTEAYLTDGEFWKGNIFFYSIIEIF